MINWDLKMKFFDRRKAGEKLTELFLKNHLQVDDSLILALPRGGVVVAAVMAEKLKLPLDIIVTRKIGAPSNPEYAIAAVSLKKIVLNESEKPNEKYLKEQVLKERQEILRRMKEYRGDRLYPSFKGKTIILVDDGLATGLTMQAAIEEIKLQKPARIIVAVPVAPPETFEMIKSMVDKAISLSIEPIFWAVGQFYQNFYEVSDLEVKKLLNRSDV